MDSFKFNFWNILKKRIDSNISDFYFYEREVWYCSIGQNIGSEENGKNNLFERPVLILVKLNKEIFWEVCLTSKIKVGKYYYFSNEFKSTIILSQFRILDSKRLIRKIGVLNKKDYCLVLKRIINILKTKTRLYDG